MQPGSMPTETPFAAQSKQVSRPSEHSYPYSIGRAAGVPDSTDGTHAGEDSCPAQDRETDTDRQGFWHLPTSKTTWLSTFDQEANAGSA